MESKTRTASKSKRRKLTARMGPFKRFYELICDKRKSEQEESSSSSIPETRESQGSLLRGQRQSNRDSIETSGYYTIEDEIRIPSPGQHRADEGTIIIQFHDKPQMDDTDESNSILRPTPSIETQYIRPTAACCYCSEDSITTSSGRKRKSPRKNSNPKRILRSELKRQIRKNAAMKSMLSDGDDKENGIAEDDTTDENGPGVDDAPSFTVEECEASFMQELESSQCENYNLENSHWRKGFDFVRS